jgi:hypothetical protein
MRMTASVLCFAALLVSVGPALADDLQVKVVSVTSVATPRAPIKLVVQTDPSATCGGTVHWQFKQGTRDFNLRQKTAGDDGMIEWTWAAPQSAARGTIGIMCSAGDKRGNASTSVQVQ